MEPYVLINFIRKANIADKEENRIDWELELDVPLITITTVTIVNGTVQM